MLNATELYNQILSFMRPGGTWASGRPNSLYVQKVASGIVAGFKEQPPLVGPCGTGPTPHTHVMTIDPSIIAAHINQCGFTGHAVDMASNIGNAISGTMAQAMILSVTDGCSPHTHTVSCPIGAQALAASMRGGLTGQYINDYTIAVAQGVLNYVPANLGISVTSHPSTHSIS